MVHNILIEKYFSRTTPKNTTIKIYLSFTIVKQILGRQQTSSAITHFRLSEPPTPLRGTQFEKK